VAEQPRYRPEAPTAEQLRRYAAGKLTPAERHAVERYLLDHPLHAAALEGTQAMRADGLDPAPAHADLQARLRQRLGRAEKRRLVSLWGYGAAAGLVLLLLSTFFWKTSDERQPRATSEAIRPPAEVPAPLAARPEIRQPDRPPQLLPPGVPADADTGAGLAEEIVVGVWDSERRAVPLPDSGRVTNREDIAAAVPAPAVARESVKRGVTPPSFSGRVLDSSQQPVAGASVVVKGTTRGTTTDAQGQFRLNGLQPGQQLTLSSIGYRSRDIRVRDTLVGTIVLEPDVQALSEVVVIGYGTQQRRSVTGAVSSTRTTRKTQPEGGLEAFRAYLQQARRVPAEAVRGTVVVRFTVQPDGSLANLRVTNPLSPAHDAEALRLVREGPRWIPATRRGKAVRQRVRVEVPF
jgi:TonB family protein